LILLTNGQINDFEDTVDAVVESSALPISIVVVGLGDSDFALMEYLDSDEDRLIDRIGRSQKRDNLQFVQYNNTGGNMIELKKEILAELPDQMEE